MGRMKSMRRRADPPWSKEEDSACTNVIHCIYVEMSDPNRLTRTVEGQRRASINRKVDRFCVGAHGLGFIFEAGASVNEEVKRASVSNKC